jgi:membrane protease YdiL (CAAX protease family)
LTIPGARETTVAVSSPSHIARPPALRRRTLVAIWAKAIVGLAVAKVVSLVEPTGLLAANLAGVAAFLFIALPDARLRARGEGWDAYGLPWEGLGDPRTWRAWGRGAAVALGVAAVVFPLFALTFGAYAALLPALPAALARALAPYAGAPRFAFRLPDGVAVLALVQLLVVALPEELFYRGFVQTAWARTAPERGVTVLGARLGAGFLWTQVLFAAGHLVVLQPWRLGTFFPGLLFGWLRARTGSLAAPVILHALSNVFIATLEASFYGPR